jgi:hypothetical protein
MPDRPTRSGADRGEGSGADALERLSAAACGFVLGRALAPGGGRANGCAGAGGRDALEALSALTALAALPPEARTRWLARLTERVSAAVPSRIERIHPGWLRAALQGESSPILLAVVAGLPPEVVAVAEEIVASRREEEPELRGPAVIDPEPLAELRRALFAGLVDMPEAAASDAEQQAGPGSSATAHAGADPGALTDAADARWLASLSTDRLLEELARLGATVLGASLGGAPPEVIARAAARAGQPAAQRVLSSARAALSPAARSQARARVAAAAELLEQTALGPATAVGLAEWAHRLANDSDGAAHAVAQRLPPSMGQLLLQARARALAAADSAV